MSRQVQGGLTVAALVLVPLLAVAGGDAFRAALDFTTGVLSLLSLTAAVAWGLMATDRLLLSPRHRLLAQGVHRATAIASLGFLLLHVTVKVALGHVALLGALVPFGLGLSGTNGLIGFGSLAGLLMIVAATTGAMRSAFAVPGRFAGRWRAMHMVAYPAWCFALVHGLYTGRPAATWVVTMYCLALLAVAGAVSLRLLPQPLKRRIADRILVLTGGVGEAPEPEQIRRDLVSDPLPGAMGIPQQRDYRQRSLQESAVPAQPAGPALGRPRTPPRLAAPAPPLYEATRSMAEPFAPPAAPPSPDPFAVTSSDPFAATGPLPDSGTGTGISAGYRAVSLGGETTARIPAGEIPLAERVPMTEELPIVEDPQSRPGSWPAPSPPPPAQAFAPPASTPYDTGEVPSYGPGGASPHDTGANPSYPAGGTPSYDTGATPGATPVYGPDAPSPYDTGALPTYDTGSMPAYGAGPLPPYDTGSVPAYGTPAPDGTVSPPPPSSDPAASTGPLYPPPAGEPWHAPAGDRP
ncbi:hypothetical protein KQY30_24320 [Streptomyces sp. GMY02]|uniref:ferric reductase-like transmembrane domain-containing protein n=1 Tax=Streptomyces sp. GMY02 TaxID=1333528 RepID=UPI001C2BB5C8|nr:ferric reductase-like transmembrane domain-containing protein [Streptomyces sp. GMY02]QXE39382.1 hypothetical protein KQY30_24320 [Streptomyces sp. GMY02]